jgi:hypothetical protein
MIFLLLENRVSPARRIQRFGEIAPDGIRRSYWSPLYPPATNFGFSIFAQTPESWWRLT